MSNIVAQGDAAEIMSIVHQPPSASRLKYTVSGGTGSGTITVTGTVGGATGQTEIMTFTSPHWQLGTKNFTVINSIVTTGLHDESPKPTIKIEYVDTFGNPLNYETADSYPCNIRRERSSSSVLRTAEGGLNSVQLFFVQTDKDIPLNPGDLFTIDGWLDSTSNSIQFKVYSPIEQIPSIIMSTIIKREFWAIRL